MKKLIFACLLPLAAGCAPQAPLTTAAVPPTAAVAAPKQAAPSAPAPRAGEMSFAAEKVAKETGCYRSDSAALMAKRTGIEFYRVPCDSGRQVLVRCELRQCRLAD